MWERVNFNIDL